MSFQAAMRRLGGEIVAASNGVPVSSVYKGENLADTVRAAGCYADAIILRHPDVGSSYEAAYYLDKLRGQIQRQPVIISGGDGVGEHPSQALLDMFTILDFKKSFDGLTITLGWGPQERAHGPLALHEAAGPLRCAGTSSCAWSRRTSSACRRRSRPS